MRETGIFTSTTSSLCRSLRQRPSRYAIRAGRNLPDKEFRYLRTVIVTAAIHQGFDSRLPRPLREEGRGKREEKERKTLGGFLFPLPFHLFPSLPLSGRFTPPVNLLAL